MALSPMMMAMLKMALPTIVPAAMSSFPGEKRETKEMKSSGEEVEAAKRVAPATSSDNFNTLAVSIIVSLNLCSHKMAKP